MHFSSGAGEAVPGIRPTESAGEMTLPASITCPRHLHRRGHTVSIVNPAAIKASARSRLSRTKTDRVDAALIASFCAERRPLA